MLTEYARDSVRRLRVIGLPGDSLTTRRSMERTLAGVELTPRGLPSSAIVCVRRLRAERGRDEGGRWALAVQGQIATMVATGVRPLRDVVPANGTAVIFEDEAELLACLARDWRTGSGAAWWWTSLFGQSPGDEVIRRVFRENARFVPAAIEILGTTGRAVEFIRALPDDVCTELQRFVAIAFDVPMGPPQKSNEPETIHRGVNSAVSSTPSLQSEVLARAVACVSVQSDLSVLSAAQRRFFTVALLIRRAPVLARAPGVLSALQALDSFGLFDGRVGPVSTDDGSRPSALAIDRSRAGTSADWAPIDSSAPASESRVEPPVVADAPSVEPQRVAEPHRPAEATVDRSPATDPRPGPFVTSFAGVFYLVNLAIQLEMYADFTQPTRMNPEVPLGRFLARTAVRVCGEAIREDPIWSALAALEEDDLALAADDSQANRTIDGLGQDLERLAARGLDLEIGTALPFLCLTPGRVRIGRTQLDVFFSLATHPIAIRMAGFDRNPGWVPVAGRVITFHYD